MKTYKIIVVLEVETEGPVLNLGEELCKRITTHAHVRNAEWLSVAEKAPEPIRPYVHPEVAKRDSELVELPIRNFIGKD